MSLQPRTGVVLMVMIAGAIASPSMIQAQVMNQKIVTFLESNKGNRIGGGECAHAASEALRVSGAEFLANDLGKDSPNPGDYVWGKLIKIISFTENKWSDSEPDNKSIPGDILQFGNTKIVIGNSTFSSPHHTAIVAAINSSGLPTQMYEQNVNNIRTIQKDSIDLTKVTSGWVRIYRPKPRIDKLGSFKFSLVNNMKSEETLAVWMGAQSVGSSKLTATDTMASYLMQQVSSSSPTARFTLMLSTGSFIHVDNAAGYEIYSGANGAASLRKLAR